MREVVKMRRHSDGAERTVEAEYRRCEHWNWDTDDSAYRVVVNGTIVGTIYRARESTDRQAGRIRIPGKGRPAWSWVSADLKRRNSPGLYARTRAEAVAEIHGYNRGEVVK